MILSKITQTLKDMFSHMQNQSIYDMKMNRETEGEESYQMEIGRIKRE